MATADGRSPPAGEAGRVGDIPNSAACSRRRRAATERPKNGQHLHQLNEPRTAQVARDGGRPVPTAMASRGPRSQAGQGSKARRALEASSPGRGLCVVRPLRVVRAPSRNQTYSRTPAATHLRGIRSRFRVGASTATGVTRPGRRGRALGGFDSTADPCRPLETRYLAWCNDRVSWATVAGCACLGTGSASYLGPVAVAATRPFPFDGAPRTAQTREPAREVERGGPAKSGWGTQRGPRSRWCWRTRLPKQTRGERGLPASSYT